MHSQQAQYTTCVTSVYSRHLSGGIHPRKENLKSPPKLLPNDVLKNFFSAGAMNYTNISRKHFLMDSKHGKLFVV